MYAVAIVNRRGGVGKTVTAHALGAGLLQKGYSILYCDLDSQTNLTYDCRATISGFTTIDVLTAAAPITAAIISTPHGDILPATPALAGLDIILTETGKEYRLKEALETVKSAYDFAIIDTPPSLGTIVTNALTAANTVIIPAQAEIHSLQGIGLLNDTLTAVKKYTNHALTIDGILITRYNGRAVISKDMRKNLENLAKALHTKVYNTQIRECVAVKEAQASQQSIFNYAPKSNAANDYAAFINEFLETERF